MLNIFLVLFCSSSHNNILQELPKVKLSLCYICAVKLLLLEHRGVIFYKVVPKGFNFIRLGGVLKGLNDFGGEYIKKINTVLRYFKVPLKKILSLNGLGMKVAYNKTESLLVFRLGYSHKPRLLVYPEITVFIKKNLIYLQSVSKESLGIFAFKIRQLRFPDIYKGKGIWEKTADKLLKIVKKK